MNLISKAVVNLWSIYKPMNFRGRYLITYATCSLQIGTYLTIFSKYVYVFVTNWYILDHIW